MKSIFRSLTASFGMIVVVTMFAQTVRAGCGDMPGKAEQSSWLVQASYRPGSFRLVSDDDHPDHSSIVGMWSVKFIAGGNVIDFGYSIWHSDGTEFLNSGGRSPATQNYCLGVWKQTGPFTYKLNHLALSYDLSGNLNAHVNIREDVTLAHDGGSFDGTFTIDVYDPITGTTLLQHVAGQITGSRITVN